MFLAAIVKYDKYFCCLLNEYLVGQYHLKLYQQTLVLLSLRLLVALHFEWLLTYLSFWRHILEGIAHLGVLIHWLVSPVLFYFTIQYQNTLH